MQIQFTKKIYHKKFDHRLVLSIRHGNGDKKKPTAEVIEWLMANKFDKADWRGTTTYSYVYGTSQYTVYFKKAEVLEYLQQTIAADFISMLEKPLDEEHTKLLESNDKLVTRKQLFYGKYRMCLRVAPEQLSTWQTSTANITKIKEWCTEQFGHWVGHQDRYMISGWSKGNFYFADPKDALLFKLTWGGQDVKTERVITVAELEAERAKQQEAA